MASLSGFVYLDYNHSDVMDKGDYAIRNARIELTRSDDAGFKFAATTDKDGYYIFDNLPPVTTGKYTMTMEHYTCVSGKDNLGKLYDTNGVVVADTTLYGTAQKDSFTGITLQSGFKGASYNFGEKEYPLELLTKRIYMDWGTPQEVIVVVPEPASLGLLLMGGLTLGLIRLRRR